MKLDDKTKENLKTVFGFLAVVAITLVSAAIITFRDR